MIAVYRLVLLLCSNFVGVFSKNESELIKALLTNYNTYVRPATESGRPVSVSFDLRLTKLVRLDIKAQEMVINGKVLMKWQDTRLTWSASEYNGTNRLVVPNQLFWTPDIMLHNTAADTSVSGTDVYKAHLRVNNNGTVLWMSPVTLHSSCDINIKWFPFDSQVCGLVFGSTSMTKEMLDLKFYKQPKSVEAFRDKFHYSSGIWSVGELSSQLIFQVYDCCPDPFSLMQFELKVARLPAYYVLYLVLPCLCLCFMSLCIFFIPPDTGERTGFGITVVLAMSVYLLVISDKLPEKSNQRPLIGVLYIILFFIMSGTLLAVVFTTHLAFKRTKPPRTLRHFFCNRCLKKKRKKEIDARRFGNEQPGTHRNEKGHENLDKNNDDVIELTLHRRRTFLRTSSNLHREFAFVSPEEEKEIENQDKWKEIAESFDRIFFWIFTTLSFVVPLVTTLSYMNG